MKMVYRLAINNISIRTPTTPNDNGEWGIKLKDVSRVKDDKGKWTTTITKLDLWMEDLTKRNRLAEDIEAQCSHQQTLSAGQKKAESEIQGGGEVKKKRSYRSKTGGKNLKEMAEKYRN